MVLVRMQEHNQQERFRALNVSRHATLLSMARRAYEHRHRLIWSASGRCIIAVPITPMTSKGPV